MKWSVIVFLLLLPFACHAAWDYLESRRLKTTLDAIVAAGEPLTPRVYVRRSEEEDRAARYYRAAATLTAGSSSEPELDLVRRFELARRQGDFADDLTKEMARSLERHEEALTFADRAAVLRFAGFSPGPSTNYLTSDLMRLGRLCGLRAVIRALERDGAAAIDSLYCQIQIMRAGNRDDLWDFILQGASVTDVQLVLSQTRPPREALERLAQAIADVEGDEDQLRRRLVSLRATIIQESGLSPLGSRRMSWEATVLRPLNAHALNRNLHGMADRIAAARGPWPDQIDQVSALDSPMFPFVEGLPLRYDELANLVATRVGTWLARCRSMRLALATESYRRDHTEQLPASMRVLVPQYLPAVLLDPFSGSPLVLKLHGDGYTAYSVGINRRDDGGDVLLSERPEPGTSLDTPDIGIRITRAN